MIDRIPRRNTLQILAICTASAAFLTACTPHKRQEESSEQPLILKPNENASLTRFNITNKTPLSFTLNGKNCGLIFDDCLFDLNLPQNPTIPKKPTLLFTNESPPDNLDTNFGIYNPIKISHNPKDTTQITVESRMSIADFSRGPTDDRVILKVSKEFSVNLLLGFLIMGMERGIYTPNKVKGIYVWYSNSILCNPQLLPIIICKPASII